MSLVQKVLSAPSYLLPESFKQLSKLKKLGVISGVAGTIFAGVKLGQHINGRFARLEEGEEERRREVQRLQGEVREQASRLARLEKCLPKPEKTRSLQTELAGLDTDDVYQQKLGKLREAFSSKRLQAFFANAENGQAFTDSLGRLFKVLVEKGAGTGGATVKFNMQPEKKCEAFQKLLAEWKGKMGAAAPHMGEQDWQLMSVFLAGVLHQGLPLFFGKTQPISQVKDDQLFDAWGTLIEPFPTVPFEEVSRTEQVLGKHLTGVAPLWKIRDAIISRMNDRAKLLKSKINERLTGSDAAVGEWLDTTVDLRSHLIDTFLVLLYENDNTKAGKEFWEGVKDIPVKYSGDLKRGAEALYKRMMEFYRANANSSLHKSRDALQIWHTNLFNNENPELLTPAGAVDLLTNLLGQHL